MLIGIAVLTVWVPRVVGQAVDGLVAGTLHGAALGRELVSLVIMGRPSTCCAWVGGCSSFRLHISSVSSFARAFMIG